MEFTGGYNPQKWSYDPTYNWFLGLPCRFIISCILESLMNLTPH